MPLVKELRMQIYLFRATADAAFLLGSPGLGLDFETKSVR